MKRLGIIFGLKRYLEFIEDKLVENENISRYGNSGDDVIDRDIQWISTCAYYKAEARGFEPGHELDDWLAAELEVDDGAKNG